MDLLHAKQTATASEIQQDLPDAPSYSAVRTLLRILEEKGHIRHRSDGARYVYLPKVSKQTASRSALKRVVATFFQGSVAQTVAALLEKADRELSDSELDQLEEIIRKAKKEGR